MEEGTKRRKRKSDLPSGVPAGLGVEIPVQPKVVGDNEEGGLLGIVRTALRSLHAVEEGGEEGEVPSEEEAVIR